jgi:hypothetical protein
MQIYTWWSSGHCTVKNMDKLNKKNFPEKLNNKETILLGKKRRIDEELRKVY